MFNEPKGILNYYNENEHIFEDYSKFQSSELAKAIRTDVENVDGNELFRVMFWQNDEDGCMNTAFSIMEYYCKYVKANLDEFIFGFVYKDIKYETNVISRFTNVFSSYPIKFKIKDMSFNEILNSSVANYLGNLEFLDRIYIEEHEEDNHLVRAFKNNPFYVMQFFNYFKNKNNLYIKNADSLIEILTYKAVITKNVELFDKLIILQTISSGGYYSPESKKELVARHAVSVFNHIDENFISDKRENLMFILKNSYIMNYIYEGYYRNRETTEMEKDTKYDYSYATLTANLFSLFSDDKVLYLEFFDWLSNYMTPAGLINVTFGSFKGYVYNDDLCSLDTNLSNLFNDILTREYYSYFKREFKNKLFSHVVNRLRADNIYSGGETRNTTMALSTLFAIDEKPMEVAELLYGSVKTDDISLKDTYAGIIFNALDFAAVYKSDISVDSIYKLCDMLSVGYAYYVNINTNVRLGVVSGLIREVEKRTDSYPFVRSAFKDFEKVLEVVKNNNKLFSYRDNKRFAAFAGENCTMEQVYELLNVLEKADIKDEIGNVNNRACEMVCTFVSILVGKFIYNNPSYFPSENLAIEKAIEIMIKASSNRDYNNRTLNLFIKKHENYINL